MTADASARERLIVALDLRSVRDAENLVERLGDSVVFYKIGYHLAFAGGLGLADLLVRAGKRVFLDMKLHDIGSTVTRGVETIARTGVTFLTIHAYPQTMKAAAAARQGSGLRLLAVSVLTSYDDADLFDAGYGFGVEPLVMRRALQAEQIGIDGLVCSAREAVPLRRTIGSRMLLVTPGIRPAGVEQGDQKRAVTPAQAIAAGADHLVVGRPIVEAGDPKAAAEAVVADIVAAQTREEVANG